MARSPGGRVSRSTIRSRRHRPEEVIRCVATALTRLGATTGATHTKVKVDGGRVVLIETHTRPGGDRIPRITELVSGYDRYELAIRSVLDPDAPLPSPGQRHAPQSRKPSSRCTLPKPTATQHEKRSLRG